MVSTYLSGIFLAEHRQKKKCRAGNHGHFSLCFFIHKGNFLLKFNFSVLAKKKLDYSQFCRYLN